MTVLLSRSCICFSCFIRVCVFNLHSLTGFPVTQGDLKLFVNASLSSVLLAGCSRKSKKHRQGLRHEDSQQVGDAEAS